MLILTSSLGLVFLKGFIIGVVIAAPVGQVNVMIIRRTLGHGRLAGWATGLGGAFADITFGVIAAFGLAAITRWLLAGEFWLALIGAAILVLIGVRAFTRPPPEVEQVPDPATLAGDFTTAFFLAMTNPIAIVTFTSIFVWFGVAGQDQTFWSSVVLVAGVGAGSMAWSVLIIELVAWFRDRFTHGGLKWANRVAGVLCIAGACYLLGAVLVRWIGGA